MTRRVSSGFKAFLVLLLAYVAFWSYRLRQSDYAAVVTGLHDPEALTAAAPRTRPDESSPVDSVVVIWRDRRQAEPERRSAGAPWPPEIEPRPITSVVPDFEPSESRLEPLPAEEPAATARVAAPAARVEAPAPEFRRQRLELLEPPGAEPSTEIIEHVVAEGETLWKIARRYLGSGTRRGEILAENGIENEHLVIAGTRLRIPVPSGARRQESGGSAPAAGSRRAKALLHRVRDGETLAALARHYYRNPDRWGVIFEANRGVVKDPNRLRIGVELRIPDVQ